MTVEMIPRRPSSRRTAAMLTVPVAALALVLAPHNTPAAHADTDGLISQLSAHISQRDSSLWLNRAYEHADGTVYDLVTSSPPQQFTIDPHDDGTFRLINGVSSKCVDVATAAYAGDLTESDCADAAAQKWYVQPVSDAPEDAERFLIRHVGDDKCMVPGAVTSSATVAVRACKSNNAAQNWRIAAPVRELRTMAVKYALKQFDAKSGVVPRAEYKVDDSTTATLGDFQNVTADGGRIVNGTSETMDKMTNWSQTTGHTYTAGGSVTTTTGVTLGASDGPVKLNVDVAIQGNWSNSWRTDNTQGGSATIHIKPNQYGWFLRAQLTKKVTGTWTMTNDVGNSWTGVGTATVPAKEGTDGKNSDLIGCSSDSDLQVCKDHDPGRP
ncbi:RICIN domain-containing protein [Streptomyces sp. Edi2]|uniref:RICIN domain-containing protein n=1 Tax=Streptomyces sp. Edi2 TaxID=3162528 RepID=UPI00330639CB